MSFGYGVIIRDINKNRFNCVKKTKIWARTWGEKHLGLYKFIFKRVQVSHLYHEKCGWKERMGGLIF